MIDNNKYNYKKLLSEKQFLRVHERARNLTKYGTKLVDVLFAKGRLQFKTRSGTDPVNKTWVQTVDLTACTPEQIQDFSFNEIKNTIYLTGMKIHCDCPAFHYWGYKYMAWKNGYGLQEEKRRPVVRNPYEKGYLCKHLYLVMQCIPFLANSIASKMGRYLQTQKKEVKEVVKEQKNSENNDENENDTE